MSNYYTYEDLLSLHGEDFVLSCRIMATGIAQSCSYAVFRWDKAPQELQDLCSQGGDEDWLVITNRVKDMLPVWVEHMDAGTAPVTYNLKNCLIWVGFH